MNTSNFTYRDFIVYFTTGTVSFLCLYINFFDFFNDKITIFLSSNEKINQFTFLISVTALSIIYITGHFIHCIDYMLGASYRKIYRFNEKNKCKILYRNRKFIEIFIYRNRVIYWALKKIKTPEEFWTMCAKLQFRKHYGNCEYWYSLNDLFKGLYLIFILSTIIAICNCDIILFFTFILLSFLSHFNGKRFAKYFVNTVLRNNIASNQLQ